MAGLPSARKELQLAICRYLAGVKEPRTLAEIRKELQSKFPRDDRCLRLKSIDVLKDLRILIRMKLVARGVARAKDLDRVAALYCAPLTGAIVGEARPGLVCAATKYVYRSKEVPCDVGHDARVGQPGRRDDESARGRVGR